MPHYKSGWTGFGLSASPAECRTEIARRESDLPRLRSRWCGNPVEKCRPQKLAFQINVHDDPNGLSPAEYKKLGAGKISDRKSNESRETACSREMILRALRAVGYGQTLPEWNRSVLKVEDGSPGGNQAIAAAGLLPDQGYNCHVFIPWRCDPGGVISGRPGSWRPDHTPALRCFDPVHHAKRIRHSAGINAGLADYGCPPSGGPHRGRGSDSWFIPFAGGVRAFRNVRTPPFFLCFRHPLPEAGTVQTEQSLRRPDGFPSSPEKGQKQITQRETLRFPVRFLQCRLLQHRR